MSDLHKFVPVEWQYMGDLDLWVMIQTYYMFVLNWVELTPCLLFLLLKHTHTAYIYLNVAWLNSSYTI